MNREFKDLGDAVSGLVTVGAILELLPAIAALLAIIWTVIRIYEWARYRLFGHEKAKSFE